MKRSGPSRAELAAARLGAPIKTGDQRSAAAMGQGRARPGGRVTFLKVAELPPEDLAAKALGWEPARRDWPKGDGEPVWVRSYESSEVLWFRGWVVSFDEDSQWQYGIVCEDERESPRWYSTFSLWPRLGSK